MNNKGQMFAGYRLLIGAIIGLLILVIIVGAVSYLQRLEVDISRQQLYRGIQNGVKQPNGDILVVKDIILPKSLHSQSSLGAVGGIDGDCIEIDAIDNDAFELGSETIEIKKQIMTSVYIQCMTNYLASSCPSSCEICCTISFGKKIV